jgi:hypothetical protein
MNSNNCELIEHKVKLLEDEMFFRNHFQSNDELFSSSLMALLVCFAGDLNKSIQEISKINSKLISEQKSGKIKIWTEFGIKETFLKGFQSEKQTEIKIPKIILKKLKEKKRLIGVHPQRMFSLPTITSINLRTNLLRNKSLINAKKSIKSSNN